jgi:hypothetical protein
MKTTIFLLAATLGLSFNAMAKKEKNPKTDKYDGYSCLHIIGEVETDTEDKNEDQTFLVELVEPNKTVETIFLTNGETKFELVLKKNTNYLIRISKKGYIKKSIAVNTEILTLDDEIYEFKFNVSLMKESEMNKLNKNLVNFPVAMVRYDYKSESFIHDEQYFDMVKKELYNTNEKDQVLEPKRMSNTAHSFLAPLR